MAGLYHYIRHPLYTAGLGYFLAMALAAASWLLMVAVGLVIIFLQLRIPKGEAKLAQRFGDDCQVYQRRTGLFLPRLTGQPDES